MRLTILFLLIASNSFAQLADKTLEGQLNDFVTTAEALIVTKQADFFSSKGGKYYQGIWTHTDANLPADGATATPVKTVKPTDQTDDWNSFGISFASKIPTAVSITYYNGPQGKGYVVHYKLLVLGEQWMRSVNTGPEDYRTHDWRKLL
jgi:hypothetical protein